MYSHTGVERIYTIKEVDSYKKKPLTLLCKDISQISTFTTATNFKSTFKMLKNLLPGPYTVNFSATNDVPRMVLEHKNRLFFLPERERESKRYSARFREIEEGGE